MKRKMQIFANKMKEKAILFFQEHYDLNVDDYTEKSLLKYEKEDPQGVAIVLFALMPDEERHIKELRHLCKWISLYSIPTLGAFESYDIKFWHALLGAGVDDFCLISFDIMISKEASYEIAERKINNLIRLARYKRKEKYDPLTGCLNKKGFCLEAEEFLKKASDKEYLLILSDVERFKVINDLFGMKMGDKLICRIADILKRYFENMVLFGHWEADQFVYLIEKEYFDEKQLEKVQELVIEDSSFTYHVVNRFGIYLIHNVMIPMDLMVSRAKLALKSKTGYHMKRYAFYDESMRKHLLEEQEIVNEMENALEQGQFQVYYQPIYDIVTEKPVSAEALVRWIHPTKGIISPGLFIPVFEKNGFISKLDAFVKERVCQFIKDCEERGYGYIPISVNISRISFYDSDVYNHIEKLMYKYNIDVHRFRVEVTESAYTDNEERLRKTVNRLQNMGVKILMDDFGSGYSSLNMLKEIPVDYLKLDMRFLDDIEQYGKSGSIMASVVQMAKRLNMTVIAEGVESKEQLEFLRGIGCDLIQGFYFSRPLKEDDFISLIKDANCKFERKAASEVDIDAIWNGLQAGNMMFTTMTDALAIYELSDKELQVQRVNDRYYELFGLTPNELYKNGIDIGILPEDKEKVKIICRKAEKTGKVEGVVIHQECFGKEERCFHVNIHFLGKTANGSVFSFSFSDITEVEKYQKNKDSCQYQRILKVLFDEVYELNFTAQTFTKIYSSEETSHIFERRENLLSAYEEISRNLIHPRDVERYKRLFDLETLKKLIKNSDTGYYAEEFQVKKDDGSYGWISKTIVPFSSEGKDAYISCIKRLQASYN